VSTLRKSQFRLTALAIAPYFLVFGVVQAQSMNDLGTLGGTNSVAFSASGDGSVIVGYSFIYGSGANIAFKYSGNTMTNLGTLGGRNSYARGISADGSVIVGYSDIADNINYRAFKYTGTTMTDLGTLGGGSSIANGISADGSVIVGASYIPGDGAHRAFKYIGTTMTDLGTLGGTNSSAQGVSADGSVIVGHSQTIGDSTTRAFKYTGTTMTDLGTLGGSDSYAQDISADGKVIVGYSKIAGNSTNHAFKYLNGVMTDLGTLGGVESRADGISADGRVIVGYSEIANGDDHAFVYGAWANGGLVDVQNTYAALSTQGYQLNSLLNAQNTALAINLNSDCTVFGANNVCVGVGGRYTNISSPSITQTTGNIQVGYRFNPTIRAGVFLDQGISNSTPNNYTVKNSQPLAGLFAVYAPSGTNLGLQVKASGAYSSNGVNISRNTLANTESGQGSSTMTTQGAQLETAYGFNVTDSWTASPLLGIKTTQVSRSGYTETAGATFPISYNTVNQLATTAYAGAKIFGYVAPKVSIGASAGIEQDLSSNIDSYSGSIYFLGAFNQAAPAIQKTRAFVAANTDYWIEKNQRVSLGVYYNQQSLNTANGVTAMLNYTVGL
jgi:probable HAF family extracellular repeat protein